MEIQPSELGNAPAREKPNWAGNWTAPVAMGLAALCIVAAQGIRRGMAEGRSLALEAAVFHPRDSRSMPPGRARLNQPTEFYLPGCPACQQTAPLLGAVEDDRLRFDRIDVSTPEGSVQFASMMTAVHVPSAQAAHLPVVFLGKMWLSGPNAIAAHLNEYADRWKRGEGRMDPIHADSESSAVPSASAAGPNARPVSGNASAGIRAHGAAPSAVDGPTSSSPSGPASLPSFHLRAADGREVTNDDLHGRPALLVFLCGCDRCSRFARVWKRQNIPPGVTVWGVSGFSRVGEGLWPGRKPAFPILFDADQSLAKTLNAKDCPQARLVDSRGRIAWSGGGRSIEPETLARTVAERICRAATLSMATRDAGRPDAATKEAGR